MPACERVDDREADERHRLLRGKGEEHEHGARERCPRPRPDAQDDRPRREPQSEAVAASRRNGMLYVTPRVTGRAFLTGFHQFVLDPADPLPEGFRIGPTPRREPRLPQ